MRGGRGGRRGRRRGSGGLRVLVIAAVDVVRVSSGSHVPVDMTQRPCTCVQGLKKKTTAGHSP